MSQTDTSTTSGAAATTSVAVLPMTLAGATGADGDLSSAVLEKLSEAYAQFAPLMIQHCRFRLLSTEDAEEIVQEAFIKVYEYLRAGKQVQNMRVFLYSVTNNLIVDWIRSRKTQKGQVLSLDELREKGFDLYSDSETGRVHQRMEAKQILAASRKLDREDYNLIVMRYVDGLMPNDIAAVTGLSANVVSVRLHRSLKQLTVALDRL